MDPVRHLYIHVPFCASKCKYCAFYSTLSDATQMAKFVDAVLADLGRWPTPLTPSTIFIGGGTPSLLPLALMRRLLQAVGPADEFTMECNPATVDFEKAQVYRQHGVNRISLGVQALDDELLKSLGRIHTADQAFKTYRLLRAAGYDNLNLDLLFGIPGQSLSQWQDTLQQAIALHPEHVSAYCLTREEGTAFATLDPNDDLEREMFEVAVDTLTHAGYQHYEISNFAQPSRECQHNLAYWRGEDYLGLGPSAVSTIGLRRWTNGGEEEQLTPAIKRAERIAFGLRMLEGVPAEFINGFDISRLLDQELVQWRGNRLQLTRRGLLFADEVSAEFV